MVRSGVSAAAGECSGRRRAARRAWRAGPRRLPAPSAASVPPPGVWGTCGTSARGEFRDPAGTVPAGPAAAKRGRPRTLAAWPGLRFPEEPGAPTGYPHPRSRVAPPPTSYPTPTPRACTPRRLQGAGPGARGVGGGSCWPGASGRFAGRPGPLPPVVAQRRRVC